MIGFLDCYSGLSGDMLLGAIIDAGLPIQRLEAVIDALRLGGDVRIWAETVDRSGLRATSVHVEARGDQPHRTLASVTRLVEASSLPEQIRASSLAVLTRIAEVEGRIHGRPTDEVELHELGALDSVIYAVAARAGLAGPGIEPPLSP